MAFTLHELDPRPRFSRPRLVAGAFAGAVGGLVFGLLMMTEAMRGSDLRGTGLSSLIARFLGTSDLLVVWGAHLAAATVFGLLFASFVAPWRMRRTIPLAVAYGALLWALAAFVGLRTLTGTPLVLDPPALLDLVGHLLFGLVLGVVYVAFFHQEDLAAHDAHTRPAP